MSKKKRITLCVLALFVLLIAVLLAWQWNNVKAVFQFLRHDESTLEEMLVTNEQEIEKTLEEYPELSVTPLDEETKQKLQDGSLTEEEVAEILTQGKKPPAETKKPAQSTAANTTAPKKETATGKTLDVETANEEIAQLVARVYVIQADFLGRLANIEARARAELHALPKSEQTKERKIAIGKSYVGEMSALESKCDGEISAIVSKVRKLLTQSGQKTTLADTIQNTYEREKSLKKAYYMNRYL